MCKKQPMAKNFSPAEFLDLNQTEHAALFTSLDHVWEAFLRIAPYLQENLRPAMLGRRVGNPFLGERVFVGPGTVIEPGACIKGPAWIGANCEIRNGAYLRENVIVGDGCVLGNSCEFKNAILFDGVQVPHFNYVGDSILGFKAHLGAGVILSNVKLNHNEVCVTLPDGQTIATGLRKFGAIVGDLVEIGCNSVLSPGSLIGRGTVLYPGSHWHGVAPAESVIKQKQSFDIIRRKE